MSLHPLRPKPGRWCSGARAVLALISIFGYPGCLSASHQESPRQDNASKTLRTSAPVDEDGLPLKRLVAAPLQDERTLEAPVPCTTAYRALAAELRRVLPVRRIHWEYNRRGANGPQSGAIRSYSYRDIRMTERVTAARPPRLLGLSYVNLRNPEEWPFSEHLALYRFQANGDRCRVTIRTYFHAPVGLASFRARQVLLGDILPTIQRRLAQLNPRPEPRTLPIPGSTPKAPPIKSDPRIE